jgi:hypothetical protein
LVYIIYNKSGGTNSKLRFNSDSGSNYSATQLYADGSSVASLRESNQTRAPSGTIDNDGMAIGHIMNYSNTTTYKTFIARGGAGTGNLFRCSSFFVAFNISNYFNKFYARQW